MSKHTQWSVPCLCKKRDSLILARPHAGNGHSALRSQKSAICSRVAQNFLNLFRVTLVKKGLKGRLGEQRETLGERVESLGDPSTEEAEKSHASLTALWTASSAADFAGNDEWPHASLSEIVVGRYSRHRHEDKEFWKKALDPFT